MIRNLKRHDQSVWFNTVIIALFLVDMSGGSSVLNEINKTSGGESGLKAAGGWVADGREAVD